MEPRILLGASPLGWVTDVTGWVSEHGGARVVGHALVPDDVDPTGFDLLVLDGWSSLLSRRLVDRVQGQGAAILVLIDDEHPDDAAARLAELGVSLWLPATTPVVEIVSRATEVAAVRRFTETRRTGPAPDNTNGAPEAGEGLWVVTGSGGVVEVAVHLAAGLATMGAAVVLVDADTVFPRVAQRLGMPVTPNVLTAVDDLRDGRFGHASVSKQPAGFDVVAGLANPRGWDELTAVDAGELTTGLAEVYVATVTVVDRQLEGLAPLSGLEGRFDVARRLVELADAVLVVADAGPVGAARALHTLADVRALTDAPVHVAANRASRDGFQRNEWGRELERVLAPTSLTFLPCDATVARAAWDGRLVTRGRFARSIRRLAADLAEGG